MSNTLVRRGVSAALVAGVTVLGLLIPTGSASADGITGDTTANSPLNGKYVGTVRVTGTGTGKGGDLGVPPSSKGSGEVQVPSPCGYDKDQDMAVIKAAYLQQAGGDEELAKEMAQQQGAKLDAVGGFGHAGSQSLAEQLVANWDNPGTWYVPNCDETKSDPAYAAFVDDNPAVLVPPGGPAPIVDIAPSPQDLLAIARGAMTLPEPAVQMVGPKSVVTIETFMWVRAADVAEKFVTAEAAGIAVTVTATASGTSFDSDGAPAITCGVVTAESPDCALVFNKSSGQQANKRWTVNGHTQWTAVATGAINQALPGATMDSPPALIAVCETQVVNGEGGAPGSGCAA